MSNREDEYDYLFKGELSSTMKFTIQLLACHSRYLSAGVMVAPPQPGVRNT